MPWSSADPSRTPRSNQRVDAGGRVDHERPGPVPHGPVPGSSIDLLHKPPDGSLVVVDYKTDAVGSTDLARHAELYRGQGQAYVEAVARTTGRHVSEVVLVFAAAGASVTLELTPAPA